MINEKYLSSHSYLWTAQYFHYFLQKERDFIIIFYCNEPKKNSSIAWHPSRKLQLLHFLMQSALLFAFQLSVQSVYTNTGTEKYMILLSDGDRF